MSNVDIWYQEIEEKIDKLDDLFLDDTRETPYFENYYSGMEHYFPRIGKVSETYWEEAVWDGEISERFDILWNYLADYWNLLIYTKNLIEGQFRMLTSVS